MTTRPPTTNRVGTTLTRPLPRRGQRGQQPDNERLLKQFLEGSTVPSLDDLHGELECHICNEPYLTGESPEFPVRLGSCGHVVGSYVSTPSN